jgi:flavin-dependent dehydrogenase
LSPLNTDVVVVGAGPAGASAALNLAPLHNVLLVDWRDGETLRGEDGSRIGESLAPAARRLLSDMGLYEAFLEQGHTPCYSRRSVWNTASVEQADSLRDLDGHGWLLDRTRFEAWLRTVAVDRGAALVASTRVERVERQGDRWLVSLVTNGVAHRAEARFLIDAGGKLAPVARRLGARRVDAGRLVCFWIAGRDGAPEAGSTLVEADEDGWWYTAPLPGQRRIVAFHTDVDLPAARRARTDLRELTPPAVDAALAGCDFGAEGRIRATRAGGARLDTCVGSGWLAAGDAAMSFDPLSAQGLFHALYSGLAGAEAGDAFLNGDESRLENYRSGLGDVWAAYQSHCREWYRLEQRWPRSEFWARRR